MAVNRYDQPTEVEYISQYTPIPFDQLYRMGKEYNDQVDKAINDISTYNKEWKSFQSPIKKDVADYYSISMNPQITALIEGAAANPDNLKSADFRRQLQSAINSVDYAALSKLRQSADNAYKYIAAAQDLAKKGQYNKNWDLVNFDEYSTLDSNRIFSEISPIPYQTLQSIIDPYVKNIEESFYKGVDPNTGQRLPFTNWMAVTENNIRDILNSRYNDIIQTPQGQMWYRDIANNVLRVNPNATAQDIDSAFSQALVDASRQYIHSKPIQDKLGFDMWKYGQEHPQDIGVNKSFTQRIEAKGRNVYSNFANLTFGLSIKPEDEQKLSKLSQQYEDALKSENTDRQNAIKREYSNIMSKYGIKENIQAVLDQGASNGYVYGKQLRENINTVASALVIPYTGSRETETALQSMPNSFKSDNNVGLGITVTNLGDYTPLDQTIMMVGGKSYTKNSPSRIVNEYITNNRIPSETVGLRGAISTTNGNMNVTQQAIKRELLLGLASDNSGKKYNQSDASPSKMDEYYKSLDKIMREAGYTKISSEQLTGFSKTSDFNEDDPYGKSKGKINKRYSGGDIYYVKDYVNRFPTTGEIGSEDINNYYDKLTLTGKQAGDLYEYRQKQQLTASDNDYFDY